MGYEHDWSLFVGYRRSQIDAEPPAHWDRLEHIVVDAEDELVGQLLFRTEPGTGQEATGPFAPGLVEQARQRVAKEARRAGIGAEPQVYAVHNEI